MVSFGKLFFATFDNIWQLLSIKSRLGLWSLNPKAFDANDETSNNQCDLKIASKQCSKGGRLADLSCLRSLIVNLPPLLTCTAPPPPLNNPLILSNAPNSFSHLGKNLWDQHSTESMEQHWFKKHMLWAVLINLTIIYFGCINLVRRYRRRNFPKGFWYSYFFSNVLPSLALIIITDWMAYTPKLIKITMSSIIQWQRQSSEVHFKLIQHIFGRIFSLVLPSSKKISCIKGSIWFCTKKPYLQLDQLVIFFKLDSLLLNDSSYIRNSSDLRSWWTRWSGWKESTYSWLVLQNHLQISINHCWILRNVLL